MKVTSFMGPPFRWFQAAALAVAIFGPVQAFASFSYLVPQADEPLACVDSSTNKPVTCADWQIESHARHSLLISAFKDARFSDLNQTYVNWCRGGDRFPDGTWKLAKFRAGIEAGFTGSGSLDNAKRQISLWRERFPNAQAAKYAEAIYWTRFARNAGALSQVNVDGKMGWQVRGERLTKALQSVADLYQSNADTCPAPHALMIELLLALKAPEAQLSDFYMESAKRYPDYFPIHFAMAKQFVPSRGRTHEQYDDFVELVVSQTRQLEGRGMYARMYQQVDGGGTLRFRPDGIAPDWEKLKVSYVDLLNRYPTSTNLLGTYLNLSCRAGDAPVYQSIRTKLGYHANKVRMSQPLDVCDMRMAWKSPGNQYAQRSGQPIPVAAKVPSDRRRWMSELMTIVYSTVSYWRKFIAELSASS